MVAGRAKVARTLDALRNNKILLNKAVQHITISLETKKTGNTGTRYFLYELVPPLRYHNPSVGFTVSRDKGETAVTVKSGADEIRIETRNKTSEDILQELVKATKSSDERVIDPLHPVWTRKTTFTTNPNSSETSGLVQTN